MFKTRRRRTRITGIFLMAILVLTGACIEREPADDIAVDDAEVGSEAPEENDVDLVGSSLRCPPESPGLHADYPTEPTFDTPEEAIADANERHPDVGGPDNVGEYDVVERSDSWLDYEYADDGYLHHRWEVIRDHDDSDRWGMVALDACHLDISLP